MISKLPLRTTTIVPGPVWTPMIEGRHLRQISWCEKNSASPFASAMLARAQREVEHENFTRSGCIMPADAARLIYDEASSLRPQEYVVAAIPIMQGVYWMFTTLIPVWLADKILQMS